ncbi:MAG: ABC transporter permease [Deltaproteobacteria bacterium]|uniref:Cell division protein FtsX n=1 Tax=Candidatus Desulfacyla euxinica TaxID=2841693 RepID=A0A8J6N1G3_9DELT|nr:ABC transporter permease [Candidatus Desulfacyla euxinica]MBL7217498.1 ABC transporter permease [Desulfobacteraceae bacterium]
MRFYFVRQAYMNIRKNLSVHILSLGTIVASLLILGAFLLLFGNLNNWLQRWGTALSMSIYLKDGISEYRRDKVYSFIRGLPEAEIKRFISKEEALKDLRAALGEDAGFLNRLVRNPLPASYEIVFESKGTHGVEPERIKGELEKLDGVEEVQYSNEWLNKLEGFLNVVRLIGFIIGGLLCLCVVFIVTNTIKLTIYSRKDEIEILKLVGATDWFVKTPFLIEGTIQGISGGVLAVLMLFSGYLILPTKGVSLLGLTPLDFVFLPAGYLVLILILGAVLGVIGSFIAIGRFFAV